MKRYFISDFFVVGGVSTIVTALKECFNVNFKHTVVTEEYLENVVRTLNSVRIREEQAPVQGEHPPESPERI